MASILKIDINLKDFKDLTIANKRLKYVESVMKKPFKQDEPYKIFWARCHRFWDTNIETYFNRRASSNLYTTHQLRDSQIIRPSSTGTVINLSMKNLPHDGAWGRGGGFTKDYGKYLRKGSAPTSGKYVPYVNGVLIDKKVDIENSITKGVSKHYWPRWMRVYKPVVLEECLTMLEKKYLQGVK